MTTPMAAMQRSAGAWRARDAAGWIGLAGSPTFALMAWIAATEAPRMAICAAAPDMLSINGMAWMYLLMSLFHVAPWLRLASGRSERLTNPTCPTSQT
jgi:hypothetical protein